MDYQTQIAEAVTKFQSKAMRDLTKQIPCNKLGLPLGFWQTDIALEKLHNLPDEEQPSSTTPTPEMEVASDAMTKPKGAVVEFGGELFGDSPLDEAWIELSYAEGFPTIPGIGSYFWDRLPGEPRSNFEAFKAYTELPGIRAIQKLVEVPTIRAANLTFVGLQNLFHLYYWELRARCYDFFKEIVRQRDRLDAASSLDIENLTSAQRLKRKAFDLLDAKIEDLSGRELVDVLKVAVSLERISVGLNPNGPMKGVNSGLFGDVPEGTQINAGVLNIQQINMQNPAEDSIHKSQNLLRQALKSPDSAGLLQHLALKMAGITSPIYQIGDLSTLPKPHKPGQSEAVEVRADAVEDAEDAPNPDLEAAQNRIFQVK